MLKSMHHAKRFTLCNRLAEDIADNLPVRGESWTPRPRIGESEEDRPTYVYLKGEDGEELGKIIVREDGKVDLSHVKREIRDDVEELLRQLYPKQLPGNI